MSGITRPICRPICRPMWRAISGAATQWTPAALFAQGEQGVWYEPKPQYLYQDAAGTVPVTADGDPVGYVHDRSPLTSYPVTQEIASKRPLISLENETLIYDGVDDFLDTGVNRIGETGLFCDQNEEFFLAFYFIVQPGKTGTLIARAGGQIAQRIFQIYFDDGSDTPAINIRGRNNSMDWGLNDGIPHVIWLNWDGQNLIAGYDHESGVVLSVGAAEDNSNDRIILGARSNGTGFPLEGGVGACIIRDKSADQKEINNTIEYLLGHDT